jgi:proprotein convertase subtilisin/kexin type 5
MECSLCISATNCSVCSQGFYLRSSVSFCFSTCLDGYYYDNQTNVCQVCSPNCTICTSLTLCSVCSVSYFLIRQLSQCVNAPDCLWGLYPDNSTQVCEVCPSTCDGCSNNLTCLSCYAGQFRTLGSASRCVCMTGYYESAGQCISCPAECSACSSSAVCTACAFRYYLSRQNTCLEHCWKELTVVGAPRPTCINCPYDCITCTQYGECLSCNASENRALNPLNSRCEPMKGYYDNGKISCSKCSQYCLKCWTSMDCEECESGYVLDSTSTKCMPAVAQASSSLDIIVPIAGVIAVLVLTGLIVFKILKIKHAQ